MLHTYSVMGNSAIPLPILKSLIGPKVSLSIPVESTTEPTFFARNVTTCKSARGPKPTRTNNTSYPAALARRTNLNAHTRYSQIPPTPSETATRSAHSEADPFSSTPRNPQAQGTC